MRCDMEYLRAKSGTRQVKFRYDIIRGGVTVGTLPVISASIRNDSNSTTKRIATLTMGNSEIIDWISDRIKIHMLVRGPDTISKHIVRVASWRDVKEKFKSWDSLKKSCTWGQLLQGTKVPAEYDTEQWHEYPLGVFIPSTPRRNYGDGIEYTVEAYDLTTILVEDCVIDRYFIAKGTNYIAAIEALMVSAGIVNVMSESTTAILPTDREFEIGTSKIEIINTLLEEINYNQVWVNSDGTFVLSKYRKPDAQNITITYRDDEMSVLGNPADTILDFYDVSNIFIAVVSNPELPAPLRSVYINDNPVSALSTVRRGRNIVSQVYKPDVIENQPTLDDYIANIAFEKSQVYEEVNFETALMPFHENRDVLELRHPDFSGVYLETAWTMELSAGGTMRHTVKKVMSI